jgi:hypothetical protein
MNHRLVSMTVLMLVLGCLLLVPVTYAQPAYCDAALAECRGECGQIGFWVGLGGAMVGERWVGYAWNGGCYIGCQYGYSQCGK